jgi:hypothetical protein
MLQSYRPSSMALKTLLGAALMTGSLFLATPAFSDDSGGQEDVTVDMYRLRRCEAEPSLPECINSRIASKPAVAVPSPEAVPARLRPHRLRHARW